MSDRQLSQDHTWDYASFPAATSEKYSEMQEVTKRQSVTTPLHEGFNPNKGISIMDENRLANKPFIEKPTKLVSQNQNDLNTIDSFDVNEWATILVESMVAFLVPHSKDIQVSQTTKRFLSIERTEKRIPQEKYVIIKEVSHPISGHLLLSINY